jgi:hypothetical protein
MSDKVYSLRIQVKDIDQTLIFKSKTDAEEIAGFIEKILKPEIKKHLKFTADVKELYTSQTAMDELKLLFTILFD